jgi:hypothetical protein
MYTMATTTVEDLKPFLSLVEDADGKQRYIPLEYHNIFIQGEVVIENVNMTEVSSEGNVIFYCADGIIDNGATIDHIECTVYKLTRMI